MAHEADCPTGQRPSLPVRDRTPPRRVRISPVGVSTGECPGGSARAVRIPSLAPSGPRGRYFAALVCDVPPVPGHFRSPAKGGQLPMAFALRPCLAVPARRPGTASRASVLALSVALLFAACGGGDDGGGNEPSRGDLQVTVGGLPTDVDAEVTVSGPNGFSRTLTGSETLSNLRPGSYTVAAQSAENGTAIFGASPASQVLSVEADQTSQANVTYAQVSG